MRDPRRQLTRSRARAVGITCALIGAGLTLALSVASGLEFAYRRPTLRAGFAAAALTPLRRLLRLPCSAAVATAAGNAAVELIALGVRLVKSSLPPAPSVDPVGLVC